MTDSLSRPCPLCGSLDRTPIPVPKGQYLVRCKACGMTFVGREPSMRELQAYYGPYPVVENISPVTLQRYDELLERFSPHRMTGRILDVGCGGGSFLERAMAKGWESCGTEFGAGPIAACRAKGIRVFEGPLRPDDHPAEGYDVVCAFEVVEHLVRPGPEIDNMLKLLRPGGLLYVTVPNFNCLARRMDQAHWNVINYPEHLNHFTRRTLHRMLDGKGLRKAWLTTTGFSMERWMTKKRRDKVTKTEAHHAQDQFRERIEARWHLRLAKAAINYLLDLSGLGDSMKAGYIKPAR